MPIFDRLPRVIAADDIFISYSHGDGATYAAGVASELAARNLACRFDQWATRPGRDLPPELIRAIRRSGMLVVVVTELATQSDAIKQEIEAFLPTRRLIVPVVVSGEIRQAVWWPLLEGLHASVDRMTHEPAADDQTPTKPSSEVIDRIESSINFTARARRLSFVAVSVGLLVLAFGAAAAWLGSKAAEESAEAQRQTILREQADLGATSANDDRRNAQIAAQTAGTEANRQSALAAQATTARERAEDGLRESRDQYAAQVKLVMEAEGRRLQAEQRTAQAEQLAVAAEQQLAATEVKVREQTSIADSQRLAKLSREAPRTDYESALRLALEALTAAATDDAQAAAIAAIRAFHDKFSGVETASVMAIDPDARWLAVASPSGPAVVTQAANGTRFEPCGHAAPILNLEVSPDGRYLATIRQVGQNDQYAVEIWDLSSRRKAGERRSRGYIDRFGPRFVFSADSSRLVTPYSELLKVPTAEFVAVVRWPVAFNPKNRTFATRSGIVDQDDGHEVWEVPSNLAGAGLSLDDSPIDYLDGGAVLVLRTGFETFLAASLDASGRPTAVEPFDSTDDEGFRIAVRHGWRDGDDLIERQVVARHPKAAVASCTPSGNGAVAVCSTRYPDPANAFFYDTATHELRPLQDWADGYPGNVAVSYEGDVAVLSADKSLSGWDPRKNARLWRAAPNTAPTFAARADRFITMQEDSQRRAGTLTAFAGHSGQLISQVQIDTARSGGGLVSDLFGLLWLNPEGTRAAVRTHHALRIWDINANRISHELELYWQDSAQRTRDLELVDKVPSAADLASITSRILNICRPA